MNSEAVAVPIPLIVLRLASIFRIVGVLLLLGYACEQPAKAYADPGTGGMFYQILVAGFIGGLFRIRKLTRWLTSRRKSAD